MAVLSARARIIKQYGDDHSEENLHEGEIIQRLICYGSKQAHSSVERAGLLAGVKMRLLEPDENFR